MNHYQSPDDRNLAPEMARLAPVEAKAFFTFDHAAKRAGGKIPPKVKVREVIALAVAMTTQCGYCLQVHGEAARRLGVTCEELASAVFGHSRTAPCIQNA